MRGKTLFKVRAAGVAAHPHARRVDRRQEHIRAAFVPVHVVLAQPGLRPFIDALGADMRGGFFAFVAGNVQRVVARQKE